MNEYVKKVLDDCGFGKISNERETISKEILLIREMYDIPDHNNDLTDFFMEYNGLTVDAETAVRKSFRAYNFQGGFRISLKYLREWHEYLYEEFNEIRNITGKNLFPVGEGFAEIVSISENGEIYVGEYFAAESWDIFLEKLVNDEYHNSF